MKRILGWFSMRSLHGKIGAAALAVLVSSIVITGLMLVIVRSANETISAAQNTQERVRIYTQLQDAARDYQGASYRSVRNPGTASQRRATETRVRLENLLADVARLPASNAREADAAGKIQRQGQVVVEHFRDASALVALVDRTYRQVGSRAAMQEVERLTQPIYDLKETLATEIRLGSENTRLASASTRMQIERSVTAALVGLFLALVFSTALFLLLFLRLRPGLIRLEEGARAISAGDLDHRIPLRGKDELATLANTFDSMAISLARQQASLRKVKDGLANAVAERTAELEVANRKLSEVDGRRRAFMADISHELRTPLTIIRGEAQVALRLAESGSDSSAAFERILEQSYDLKRMVDDLFLIARAEAGALSLEFSLIDLDELGASVAADFNTIAHQTGSELTYLGGERTLVSIDADRIRRAIASLIENALKHCQQGVQIEVDTRTTDGEAVLTVSDNGPGIAGNGEPVPVERFRRGDTDSKGSGLGLSLVKAIAEAHGGRLAVEPGRRGGTSVKILLPLANASREAA